jgi:hypothetical protein
MLVEGAIDQTHSAPAEEAGYLVLSDSRQGFGAQALLPIRGCSTRKFLRR